MNDILIRSPRLQRTVSTHRHEFHSSQVRFLMQNETNKRPQNIDSIWLPDGWTACVSTKQQIYTVLSPIFCPSLFVPIHQWHIALSVQIHLCPLAVAAVTANAAVCQEACSVTFMGTGCKTEQIKRACMCVCVRYGRVIDESGC